MNHLEFAAAESAALEPTDWERWITSAEHLAGKTLDGDQATDGYSYDNAYAAWKTHTSPATYVNAVAQRTCLHCDATLNREGRLWIDALSGDDGGTYDHCPVNPTKLHIPG